MEREGHLDKSGVNTLPPASRPPVLENQLIGRVRAALGMAKGVESRLVGEDIVHRNEDDCDSGGCDVACNDLLLVNFYRETYPRPGDVRVELDGCRAQCAVGHYHKREKN